MRRSCFIILISTLLLNAPLGFGQLSTEDHLAEPGFWPTQGSASREGFVGPAACAVCHAAKVAAQKMTPMARTAMPAAMADILHAHPLMTFDANKFHYQVETGANESRYSVNDGNTSLTFPLLWAFGTGRVGQSYLFKKPDHVFYEARVTFFESLANLAFTPSRALAKPSGVEEAMDRPVSAAEVTRCFGCHSTASSVGGHFDESHLIPGVTCEACHSAGAAHVAAMEDLIGGKPVAVKPAIFNPAHLAPADAVDFCGACHGTWWDVKLSGVKGASTARSAPYRLVTSKCWGKGDARLTCTGCHDPHEQLQTDSAAYDKVCLSCHANSPGAASINPLEATKTEATKTEATKTGAATAASRRNAACPVAIKSCTSCHMPKVYVPEMHDNFTDHRIRIAQAGGAFPD